jgi:hypothetical protein
MIATPNGRTQPEAPGRQAPDRRRVTVPGSDIKLN